MYFQTLWFVKDDLFLKKYGKMIRGKQVTLHFKRCISKRCGLKKYVKMIRGKQVTLHFKRCISNVAV
jgi:hypothetical protein